MRKKVSLFGVIFAIAIGFFASAIRFRLNVLYIVGFILIVFDIILILAKHVKKRNYKNEDKQQTLKNKPVKNEIKELNLAEKDFDNVLKSSNKDYYSYNKSFKQNKKHTKEFKKELAISSNKEVYSESIVNKEQVFYGNESLIDDIVRDLENLIASKYDVKEKKRHNKSNKY